MKRSEILKLIADSLYENLNLDGGLYLGSASEDVLKVFEKAGFFPPDSYYDEDQGIVAFWELEEEEYEQMLRERKEFFDNLPRTLPTCRINKFTGKPYQTRSHEMAFMWNNGATIQEIADKFNVTRTRVETCLTKVERQMKKDREQGHFTLPVDDFDRLVEHLTREDNDETK